MSLKTAKDYLDKYKKDTAIQYINVCTFLELLIDFEQTNLEEIITYLNISSFPSSTTIYKNSRGYISPKGDDKNNCQSTCNFFDNIEKTASFSVITGFSYEIQKKYSDLYFSLLELFQSDALKHVNFTKKYAAHEAMGRGFGYLSKGSIGSLFSSNELVTGLPQQRIDELIATEHIAKVQIDSNIDLVEATDMQKIVIAKIHEYMDAQMKSYNASPTHRDEISNFLTAQSTNDKIGMPTITQTAPKSDKELIAELQAKVADLESQLVQAKTELTERSANDYQQLDERTEKSYQTTIGLLLELMMSPKGIDSKKPFPSQAVIISEIVEQSIYGQGKSTLEARFSNANNILFDVKKK